MFFKASLVSAAAFVAAVVAQSNTLLFTSSPSSVTAGNPITLTYSTDNPSSPVTILLRRGPSTDLTTVETITTSATGGSYRWTPSSSLPSGSNYALQILQGPEINYSGQFSIMGGSSGSSSAVSSMASSMMQSSVMGASSTAFMMSSATPSASASAIYGMGNTSAVIMPTGMTGMAPIGTGAPAPVSGNSTFVSPTVSASGGASSTSALATQATGSASTFGSSLALVMGAVAAFAFIN